jgi:hypothetical protein
LRRRRKEESVRRTAYTNLGLVLLTMFVAACGSTGMSAAPERAFSRRVTDGKAELQWDCSRTEAGEVRIEGVANNPFFSQPIKGFQVQVYGVASNGASVLRASASARDFLIQTNARSPFEITFRPAGTDAQYDFSYVYDIEEAKHIPRGGEERSLARNICPDLKP